MYVCTNSFSFFSYSKLEKLDGKSAELEDLLQKEQSRSLGQTSVALIS